MCRLAHIIFSQTPQASINPLARKVFDLSLKLYFINEDNPGYRSIQSGWITYFATNCETLKILDNLTKGCCDFYPGAKLQLETENLWTLCQRIVGSSDFDNSYKKEYFEIMKKKDKTHIGKSMTLKIESMLVKTEEERIEMCKRFMNPGPDIKLKDLCDSMDGFMHYSHGNNVIQMHADYFYDNILETLRKCSHEVGGTVFRKLIPKFSSHLEESFFRLQEIVLFIREDEIFVLKLVKQMIDEIKGRLKTN